MSEHVLTGAVPCLLRRGSPVFWRDEETPYVVTFANETTVLAAPGSSPCLGIEDDPCAFILDVDDPFGQFSVRVWLDTRVKTSTDTPFWYLGCSIGSHLWSKTETQMMVWSVLSVAKGGPILRGTLGAWGPVGSGEARLSGGSARTWVAPSGDPGGWALHEFQVRKVACLASGPETGEVGKALADVAALNANFALMEPDGRLSFPA